MLEPYRGAVRNIACLYAHLGPPDESGCRIYEVAAVRLSPEGPDDHFSSPVRYGRFTERERHASGLSREILRNAPPLPDVAAYLGSFLRGTEVLLTPLPREEIGELLDACGQPRVVDLAFAAEFFLPGLENTALKTLWEHLQGKTRDKLSFSAREAVELSRDLLGFICGRVLNPGEFPPAAALRHYLAKSDTLFGELFTHLTDRYRDYFGGLFAPAAETVTPDWRAFLEKAPAAVALPAGGQPRRKVPPAALEGLYGALAATHRDYRLRPSQTEYARHVAAALNDGAVLTIEAGTGTGKTQGYLIPLLEYLRRNPGARAAVSTYTKSLQEQIIRREIPLTLSLDGAYGEIPVVLLKGKSNYLCAEKLDHLYEDALTGIRLLAWLYFVHRLFHFRTAEGDAVGPRVRHHLHDGFFFRRLQQEGSAKSGCSRRHRRCPAQVVAAEAANARLIVTNHHKLALLDRDEALGGLFTHYLIDEANHFEQALRGAFAAEIASRPIADTLTYLESVLGRLAAGPAAGETAPTALAACETLRARIGELSALLTALRAGVAAGESALLPAEHPAFAGGRLQTELETLRTALRGLAAALAFLKDGDGCRRLGLQGRTVDRMKTALRDLQEDAETLKAIGEKAALPGYVTAAVLFVRHWSISLAAVEVAGLLRDHIYAGRQSVVFTSATLRNGRGFDGFRRIAGMPDPSEAAAAEGAEGSELPPGTARREFRFAALPSPFAPGAAEIVVPPGALSGAFEGKEAWLARVAELLPGLIRENRGRTLVLFSSYGDLEAVARRVSEEILSDGYPLLIQASGVPATALADEFRAIRESVLFGVDTFWYGVDFPGETLTQVIITRLPFPHPGDPIQIARRRLLSREEYWRRYRYDTAIKLRQGIGRLIRSEADHGRVVILDSRYRAYRDEGATP